MMGAQILHVCMKVHMYVCMEVLSIAPIWCKYFHYLHIHLCIYVRMNDD